MSGKKILNAISVDIEDWYHGIPQISYKDWPKYENRLNNSLGDILRFFANHKIKATFFILGYVAENYPYIVDMIVNEGHEIASHGYYHRPIYEQTPEEFHKDVLLSKKAIESITKVKIKGYRAPFFSITKKSLWALKILDDLGFEYDSSIFPINNFLYGIPDAPRTIYKIKNTNIVEFPLSVVKVMGVNFPVCGGFYLRTMPYLLTKWGILHYNRKAWPAMIYIHPWELDVGKPRIPMTLKWKIIYEYNIDKMKRKFEQLLKDFTFTTISEVLFCSCAGFKGLKER